MLNKLRHWFYRAATKGTNVCADSFDACSTQIFNIQKLFIQKRITTDKIVTVKAIE